MKKIGTPRPPSKAGIKFQYGRLDGDLDFLVLFKDAPCCDRSLVMQHFTSTQCRHDHIRGGAVFEDSFIDELEKRGYDTKTIKFSIEKHKENK